MNRLNKTESGIFATCMISLLQKDLLFLEFITDTGKVYSLVVQACHHGTAEPLLYNFAIIFQSPSRLTVN